ncbi:MULTISPECIES: hypothetical protein [Streptomyces]|uniref:Uncharacterized protein n=1 Tax=Streptomyces kasugaensis TaxID=1946 RepID=A0A4Q9HU51_STRKA|nr:MULTISPECIES: hypothetical protein [Streptomyces]MYU51658.1 hypothetical protein [Streptomyces sp. SID7805]TBO58623.1 hypothetical protein EYS09_16525 [Streptomyces kasugaensis]
MNFEVREPRFRLPAERRWPPLPEPEDHHEWLTARCWLGCRREAVRVMWVGSAKLPGGEVALYACADDIAWLDAMARDALYRGDRQPFACSETIPVPVPGAASGAVAPYAGRQLCAHAATRRSGGKTCCAACGAQLYL